MILELEKVKDIVRKSFVSEDLKQRFFSILPNLGKNTISGIGKEIKRGDSDIIVQLYIKKLEIFSSIYKRLKMSDSNSISDFFLLFDENEAVINTEQRLDFLNLVLDVRILVLTQNLNFSSEEYRRILDYEIDLFWYLPKEEIMFFVESQLLYLESKINLLEHIKVVTWEHNWDYSKTFSNTFMSLLAKNEEILGEKIKYSIGKWVKTYLDFSSGNTFRNDMVQVSEFLIKNENVKSLSSEEKKSLSEILKLFIWFSKPSIQEEAVLKYKEEINAEYAERLEQRVYSTYSKLTDENNHIKYNSGIFKPVNIDQKLEDLKKRVEKR